MEEAQVYDSTYGDRRMCKCGHAYIYHFNLETNKGWGCLFSYNCDCERFEEVSDV